MTNEEAAKELMMAYEDLKHMCYMDCGREAAFNKACENLKAEPCEDCVSREAMWKIVHECEVHNSPTWVWREMLAQLPSATPKQRTGKWMPVENDNMEVIGHYCSVCDLPMETEEKSNFCPNCGAKMEAENEDKK